MPTEKIRHSRAILVIDSTYRYLDIRVEREQGETVEQFADRVRAKVVEMHEKPNLKE